MARDQVLRLRATTPQRERWQAAAQQEGLDLASWMRMMLERAAKQYGASAA